MMQFVREIPIRIVIEKASSEKRGFLFYVAAGFSKEIDPLTGMSVYLVAVDQWLKKLQQELPKALLQDHSIKHTNSHSNSVFAAILTAARRILGDQAQTQGVDLMSLHFREERGGAFSWNQQLNPNDFIFSRSLYVETFAPQDSTVGESSFELLKCVFNWVRVQNCEADYQAESLQLIKECTQQKSSLLLKSLQAKVGSQLPSGSYLQTIEVQLRSQNFAIVLTGC